MSAQDPGEDRPERVDLGSLETERRPEGVVGWVRWGLRTNHPAVSFVREVIGSVLAVVLVGLLLFAISGIWPPMVAVESGSMEPHMYQGDLVFVMEQHRLSPSFSTGETGVVTYEDAAAREAYRKFGDHGDVIVFEANGGRMTPVIHRARFFVDKGENWVGRANPTYLPADTCSAVPNCPAPHAGFITKGDNNGRYDQVAGISGPVRPAWVKGTAEFRVPWLGYVRLYFSEAQAGGAPARGVVSGASANATLQ